MRQNTSIATPTHSRRPTRSAASCGPQDPPEQDAKSPSTAASTNLVSAITGKMKSLAPPSAAGSRDVLGALLAPSPEPARSDRDLRLPPVPPELRGSRSPSKTRGSVRPGRARVPRAAPPALRACPAEPPGREYRQGQRRDRHAQHAQRPEDAQGRPATAPRIGRNTSAVPRSGWCTISAIGTAASASPPRGAWPRVAARLAVEPRQQHHERQLHQLRGWRSVPILISAGLRSGPTLHEHERQQEQSCPIQHPLQRGHARNPRRQHRQPQAHQPSWRRWGRRSTADGAADCR
jgi:hypothetical protein